jgi:hypothetical protein
MLTQLKQQWTQLKQYPPGQRFLRRYEAQRLRAPNGSSVARRFVTFGAAAILGAIGVVLVFTPGPAVLFFFLAGAVLAEESRSTARLLDGCEVWCRRSGRVIHRSWRQLSGTMRVLLGVSLGVLAGAAAYVGYLVVL